MLYLSQTRSHSCVMVLENCCVSYCQLEQLLHCPHSLLFLPSTSTSHWNSTGAFMKLMMRMWPTVGTRNTEASRTCRRCQGPQSPMAAVSGSGTTALSVSILVACPTPA